MVVSTLSKIGENQKAENFCQAKEGAINRGWGDYLSKSAINYD